MFFISLAFDIQCAVHRSDGANAPFVIPSTVTLDEIRSSVAEKLNRYHGRISLQYRLDSDKLKAGATSIHTDDELALFKTRMRGLIVPLLLANGKPSNRAPKSVHVIFEDTGADDDHSVDKVVSLSWLLLALFIILIHLRVQLLRSSPSRSLQRYLAVTN